MVKRTLLCLAPKNGLVGEALGAEGISGAGDGHVVAQVDRWSHHVAPAIDKTECAVYFVPALQTITRH